MENKYISRGMYNCIYVYKRNEMRQMFVNLLGVGVGRQRVEKVREKKGETQSGICCSSYVCTTTILQFLCYLIMTSTTTEDVTAKLKFKNVIKDYLNR